MLDDIREGRIRAVVAWDLDLNPPPPHRVGGVHGAGRSARPLALATVSGDVDLSTAAGRPGRPPQGHRGRARDRPHEGPDAGSREGAGRAWTARLAQAFGYLSTADGPVPDPVAAPLVAQAYASVIAGGSISDIARDWNAKGHIGLTGKPWSPSTVSLFTRKPQRRIARPQRRDHRGGHLGAAGARGHLAGRADGAEFPRRSRPKMVRRHLLTGLLSCGQDGCGGTLAACAAFVATGNAPGRPRAGESKPPKRREYRMVYRCKTCFGVAVPADPIEELPAIWWPVGWPSPTLWTCSRPSFTTPRRRNGCAPNRTPCWPGSMRSPTSGPTGC